jgi:hypothetical protein
VKKLLAFVLMITLVGTLTTVAGCGKKDGTKTGATGNTTVSETKITK